MFDLCRSSVLVIASMEPECRHHRLFCDFDPFDGLLTMVSSPRSACMGESRRRLDRERKLVIRGLRSQTLVKLMERAS